MGFTTWIDRITDESNLWLSAVKAEEANDLAQAALYYLEDSTICLDRASQVRGALSCYCAAECLAKLGAAKESRLIYALAGKLYSDIAGHGVSGSIREALWALQRAYGCYLLAGELKESDAVYESFRTLARRSNPFESGADWLEMPKLSVDRYGQTSASDVALPTNLKSALERLVTAARLERKPATDGVRRETTGRILDEQESFVSQLG